MNKLEKALQECDVDVRDKFLYLDDILCDLEDEIEALHEEIMYIEIDIEIAKRMFKTKFAEDYALAILQEKKKVFLEELEYLNVKYDVVEEMYEEMMLGLLK